MRKWLNYLDGFAAGFIILAATALAAVALAAAAVIVTVRDMR